jgi:SAM-dependent methyltransferase
VPLAVPRPKHTKTRSHQPVPSPRCWCAAWREPSSASLQFGSNTAPPKPIQRWSASDYAKNGRFVQEMAGAVFAMLASKPGERILDLGCGDGVLTTEIKATGADVLGVDLSDELLAVARMKGLRVRKLDGHALDFVSEFDAVFSNMALHWMRKPKLVIAGVYRALKPRGRFVAEFGGHGNVAAIATAMRAVGALRNGNPELVTPWFFPTVEEYGALLTEGGFTVKEIEGWLRTFGRSLFDQFAEPERTKVVGKVIELLRPSLCDSHGVWTADHVRVRFIAERGA